MDGPPPPAVDGLLGWIVALGIGLWNILWSAYKRTKERLRSSEARRIDKLEERVERLEDQAMSPPNR